MDINESMVVCFKNNIKIFPKNIGSKFIVVVSIKGSAIKINKKYCGKTISTACKNAYIFYAKKIIN